MFRTSYLPAAPIAVAIAAATSVLTALPAVAQDDEGLPFPEGWEVRFDREGASMDDLYLVTMTPGYHVTTGPAMIAWHPDSVAMGDFRIESETFLFDPQGRREAFGFFIGGSDLQGPDQRYTYFLLREGGEFLVKSRAGTATPVVHDWTAHPAIVSYATKPEGSATAKNVLTLEATGDELRFSVNGEEVWSGPRDELATDGVFGLRVNHGLNLHVTTITSATADSGEGTIDIDDLVVTCLTCTESRSLGNQLRGFFDRLRIEHEGKIAVKSGEQGHPPIR